MMKFFLSLFLILFTFYVVSQDLIITAEKDSLRAFIMEQNSEGIRFLTYSNEAESITEGYLGIENIEKIILHYEKKFIAPADELKTYLKAKYANSEIPTGVKSFLKKNRPEDYLNYEKKILEVKKLMLLNRPDAHLLIINHSVSFIPANLFSYKPFGIGYFLMQRKNKAWVMGLEFNNLIIPEKYEVENINGGFVKDFGGSQNQFRFAAGRMTRDNKKGFMFYFNPGICLADYSWKQEVKFIRPSFTYISYYSQSDEFISFIMGITARTFYYPMKNVTAGIHLSIDFNSKTNLTSKNNYISGFLIFNLGLHYGVRF